MARRRSLRWWTLVAAAGVIAILGGAVRWQELGPAEEAAGGAAPERRAVAEVVRDRHGEALARRFRQGVVMLHAREYAHAALVFERVIALAPRMPEARVNMGFAMLGLGRAALAREHFDAAIDLRPGQRNAYYGLAEALEAVGDTAGALGAMRTFVHLSPPDDPFVRRARAALWEWQAGGRVASAGGGAGQGGAAP